MVDTLEEFILQELKERNCRSVHYWGDGSQTLASALIGVKLMRISCSVSKGSFDDLIRVGANHPISEGRLTQGRCLDCRRPGITADASVASTKSIAKLNPDRHPSKLCLYVGMTGLDVEQRFENHKRGYKGSAQVRKHGIRLRPEFYHRLNPMTQREAVWTEKKLAAEVRSHGYTVLGGT